MKKGITFLTGLIVAFSIVSVMFIFSLVLVQQIGSDYVIEDTANIGIDILNTTELDSSQGIDTINEVRQEYNNLAFPYDLFFLALWISTFSFTVFVTFKSNKEGIFSFFGFLFIGSVMLLLITTYLSDFVSWFMSEVFDKLFNDISVSLPIFTFYISNLGLINFIWWLVLILISVIDRNFISRTGEVQE